MSNVAFAVVLTICTVTAGTKVCHQEAGPSGYRTRAACEAAIDAAAKVRGAQSGGCRSSYHAPARKARKAERRAKQKSVAPVVSKPEAKPTATLMTATSDLCGIRKGTIRTCLHHEQDGLPDRPSCIARAQEFTKDSTTAFSYGGVKGPFEGHIACRGDEPAEPVKILPPPAVPKAKWIPVQPVAPHTWRTWLGIGASIAAFIGILILWRRSRTPAPPPAKPMRKAK